jgi:hypothetical protein
MRIIKCYFRLLKNLIFPLCFFKGGRRELFDLITRYEYYRDYSFSLFYRLNIIHDKISSYPFSYYLLCTECYRMCNALRRKLDRKMDEISKKKIIFDINEYKIFLNENINNINILKLSVEDLERNMSIEIKETKQIFCEIDPYGEECWELE